jgi:hypothetical protein
MAKLITAISAYRPRIDYSSTIGTDVLAEYISRRTALNPGSIWLILHELYDAFLFFFSIASPIHLERVGIYRPIIRTDGSFVINFRPHPSLRSGINELGFFSGGIINRQNIGLTKEDYIALWNADHPDDPIEIA